MLNIYAVRNIIMLIEELFYRLINMWNCNVGNYWCLSLLTPVTADISHY